MVTRDDLKPWILQALRKEGGRAPLTIVAKDIWDNHQVELKASGDLFYRWQYEMRWAATVLRKEGKLKSNPAGQPWELA
jgi:hypothetical protein